MITYSKVDIEHGLVGEESVSVVGVGYEDYYCEYAFSKKRSHVLR